jgi:hypothetical protein
MANITINDLETNIELDKTALARVSGGFDNYYNGSYGISYGAGSGINFGTQVELARLTNSLNSFHNWSQNRANVWNVVYPSVQAHSRMFGTGSSAGLYPSHQSFMRSTFGNWI